MEIIFALMIAVTAFIWILNIADLLSQSRDDDDDDDDGDGWYIPALEYVTIPVLIEDTTICRRY
jgi:hypothetical protein